MKISFLHNEKYQHTLWHVQDSCPQVFDSKNEDFCLENDWNDFFGLLWESFQQWLQSIPWDQKEVQKKYHGVHPHKYPKSLQMCPCLWKNFCHWNIEWVRSHCWKYAIYNPKTYAEGLNLALDLIDALAMSPWCKMAVVVMVPGCELLFGSTE